MLKKIKKYFLLIPLIMVSLLNCVCYGQVIATDDSTVDYSNCLVSFSEVCPEVLELFDYRDYHSITSFSDKITEDDDYLYYGTVDKDDYSDFISGSTNRIKLTFVFYKLTDVDIYSGPVSYYISDTISRYTIYYNINIDTDSVVKGNFSSSTVAFEYFPDSFFVTHGFSGTPSTSVRTNADSYIFLFDSSVFEKKHEVDFSNTLDVSVTFSPELTGAFNRTVSDRGQTVTLDDFSFKISNNSKFDIQYIMAIYRDSDTFLPFNSDPLAAQSDTTFTGKTYVGTPVYVYVKDEWLYLPHRQNGVITGYAPSSWHMVSSGDSDFVTINFNQVNLNTRQNYNVVVYAIRNDLSYATPFTNLNEFQVPACADYNVEIDNLQLVYSSQFSILNPAEFDATNNENSYAFDENDRLLFNRANGYIDENGEMVIDRVDTNQWVTEGSDDSWVNFDSDLNAWDTYYKNQNTVSSDIDQLSRNFSSFFKFVNKFFSYFPKNYQSITILGLTSLVVLGIIKVVI